MGRELTVLPPLTPSSSVSLSPSSSCQGLVLCLDHIPEWAEKEKWRERERGRERKGETEREGGREGGRGCGQVFITYRSTLQVLIMLTLNKLSFSQHLSLPYCIGQGRNCVRKAIGEVIKLKFMINVVFINSDAATPAGSLY